MAHDHPDAVEPNRVEGVFVSEIVADIYRQHTTRLVDPITDPGQRGALVPVDVGSQLDYLAAARHPEAVALPVPVSRGDDLADALSRRIAVVHGYGIALVLDVCSRDVLQFVAQFGRCTFQDGYRGGRGIVVVVTAVRSDELEAMTAGVPEARQARPGRGCLRDRAHSVSRPGTAPPASPGPRRAFDERGCIRIRRRSPTECHRSPDTRTAVCHRPRQSTGHRSQAHSAGSTCVCRQRAPRHRPGRKPPHRLRSAGVPWHALFGRRR